MDGDGTGVGIGDGTGDAAAAPRTIALLLAGGTGTRLYPASTPDRPKQFLTLGGERTLLRRAADRAAFAEELYAVTRERYRDRVTAIVPEATVLTDPGEDTGPALVAATHEIANREAEEVGDRAQPVVCSLPTDHEVDGGLGPTMERAAAAAVATDGLVCVGVEPDRPATGFGYIEPAGRLDRPGRSDGSDGSPEGPADVQSHAPVAAFHEKPDRDRARELIAAGALWNAGVFAWTPAALRRAAADSPLAPLVDALEAGRPADGFDAVPAVSIDHAVFERTDSAHVVPAGFDFVDLGTWDAVGEYLSERAATGTGDDRGKSPGASHGENATLGDVLADDATGNVLVSDDHRVTVAGVEDLVVVAVEDRVLVVPRSESDRVRELARRRAAGESAGERDAADRGAVDGGADGTDGTG